MLPAVDLPAPYGVVLVLLGLLNVALVLVRLRPLLSGDGDDPAGDEAEPGTGTE